jgi:ferredoxin
VDGRDVLVACCDRAHVGDGDGGRRVAELLRGALEGVRVKLVPDLCADPTRAEPDGAGGLVLGLCGPGPSSADLQALARRLALDPFGVEVVDLGLLARLGPAPSLPERAAAALASAAAALLVGGPTPPGRMRLRLGAGEVSRRGLLAGAVVTYRPVARIEQPACLGSERCALCVAACPVGAIARSHPYPSVDTDACVGCAACVSACPVDAVGVGGAASEQLEARMDAIWSWPWRERPGILFACRGAARAAGGAGTTDTEEPAAASTGPGDVPTGPDWVPVPVPCLAVVTEGWLLGAVAAGAPAVGVLGCGERCGAGSLPRTTERVTYAAAALGPDRVRLARADAPQPFAALAAPMPPPGPTRGLPPLVHEPQATAAALEALAPPALELEGGPLGVPAVRTDGCTLCGTCTTVCPTGALRLEGEGETALSLDAARCVACGHCAEICPERVVSVERRTGPETLAGRRVLKRAEAGRCRRCGAPVAPEPMLARIRELLAEESPALLEVLTGLCLDCRGR